MNLPITKRIAVAVGTAILGLTSALATSSPTAAAERKKDPNEIWPQQRLALQADVVPCDPAGPSATDGALAGQLNGQLTNKMRGYMNGYRVSCARVVTQAVKARGLNRRAAAIAIATVIVESSIDNLYLAVDHDSVGLYQQRPSQGWGTPDQCRDPVFATNSFLNVMEQFYPNGSWNNAPIGEVAADVQRPAAEYRYRYGVEANDAIKIVDALWDGAGLRPPSSSWESGRVVSMQSADGRLEAFAAGANGVHHAWQTRVNGEWSTWEFLGGPKNAELAIAPNKDGRLELFAMNAQTLDHIWQTAPSGGWSGWASFGGGGYDLAAGSNADGRIELFASNANGVFHRWQTQPNGSWSGWEGTAPGNNGPANSRLAIESAADGRLEVFALNGQTFGHLWQTAVSGGWSAWEGFGGGGHDLSTDHNADGRIEVFASGPDGVFHKWQTGASSWSDWTGTGPAGNNGPVNAELSTDRSPDGRVEVFAINGSTAAHAWQGNPNAAYGAWETFGTGGTEITTTHNRDGRIEVLATSGSGVFHRWQTGFATWSDWAWLNDAGPGVG